MRSLSAKTRHIRVWIFCSTETQKVIEKYFNVSSEIQKNYFSNLELFPFILRPAGAVFEPKTD